VLDDSHKPLDREFANKEGVTLYTIRKLKESLQEKFAYLLI
jgi:hypothetical protein